MIGVLWPSSHPHVTFYEAVEEAVKSQIPLVIAPKTVVHLSERILLKENKSILRIVGFTDDDDVDTRPSIICSGHSIFQVGGRGATLIIENLCLKHTCFRDHHKDIGGVIFALHKAKVEAINCNLYSEYGFGVWAVQQAAVKLTNCKISSALRSGCVSFGRSSLYMDRCTVHDCGIHGVCSRGNAAINIKSCKIISSGTRGVYAYHNVTLNMSHTSIENTKSAEHAAVDLWGCGLGSSCRDVNLISGASDSESDYAINSDMISGTLDAVTVDDTTCDVDQKSTLKHQVENKSKGQNCDKEATDKQGRDLELEFHANSSGAHLSDESKIQSTIDLVSTCENILEYSRIFSRKKNIADCLNITFLRCNISGNKGLGLRTRQGRPNERGCCIAGSIVDCNLQNNDRGNVLDINDCDNDLLGGDDTLGNRGHDESEMRENPDIPLYGDLPASLSQLTFQSKITNTNNVPNSSLDLGIIWEYEVDDSKANAHLLSPSSSSLRRRSTWQAYDPLVSSFIQLMYVTFLNRSTSSSSTNEEAAVHTDRVQLCVNAECDQINEEKDCERTNDEDDDLKYFEIVLPVPYERYRIDFHAMQQTNTETYYMRSIRNRKSVQRTE